MREAFGLESPVPRQKMQQALRVTTRVELSSLAAAFRRKFGTLKLYENRRPAVRGRFVVVSFTALVELMKISARVSVRFWTNASTSQAARLTPSAAS
jgi:hypothetical protein